MLHFVVLYDFFRTSIFMQKGEEMVQMYLIEF